MFPNPFIADLHVHSKFSRATARNLDLEHIHIWAQLKGITVVGTGDFTHPAWFTEMMEKLEPAEPGLYRLKPAISRCCDETVPDSCRAPVRFMLSCEISNIYKKDGRTRKNHNLVFFPDMECVRRFNTRLAAIGNISADGRPIIGLDARDLLEIVLETSDDGFLVPAHIWTPWFSMLGSKSGFDSIEACFDDLTPYVFAAETGLSSDPSMNWRVADLDNLTLISNSDAHSPSKLGREANLFNTPMSYHAIRSAMEKGDGEQFCGTFEYYPEEGKYHVDGHRKCEVRFTPAQTQANQGNCPVCGKPLTLGVLHRVEALAGRPDGFEPRCAVPFHRLIPLDNLLAEVFKVGPQSKKVARAHRSLLENLGNEFRILHYLGRDCLESAGVALLGEAVFRMRNNRVTFLPGYDGVFGTVKIFSPTERAQLLGQKSLFFTFDKSVAGAKTNIGTTTTGPTAPSACPPIAPGSADPVEPVIDLNDAQQNAVDHADGPLMIVAGPGTGKTRTLTHRIARLMETGRSAERMLAVTFTNKAAREMKVRLSALVGETRPLPFVGTFHALGYQILSRSMADKSLTIVDEAGRKALVNDAMGLNGISKKGAGIRVDDWVGWIAAAKQKMITGGELLGGVCPPEWSAVFTRCYESYQHLLKIQDLADFEDLIFRAVNLLEEDPQIRAFFINRFSDIFIDEYQDINAGQYRMVRLLAGRRADMCIIGDPDQSIYAFRGSDTECFQWFLNDFPGCRTIFLRKNYRSTQTILDVSAQVIQRNPEWLDSGHRRAVYSDRTGSRTIHVMELSTGNAEAVAIGKTIENMVGGTGFLSLDSGAVDATSDQKSFSFEDFAVLFRTHRQADVISAILEKAGIPCQVINRARTLDHPGIRTLLAVFRLLQDMGTFDDLQTAASAVRPSLPSKVVEILKFWAYRKNLTIAQALVHTRRLPIPSMGRSRQQQLYAFIRLLSDLKNKIDGLSLDETLDTLLRHTGIGEKINDDKLFEKGYLYLVDSGQAHPADAAGFLASIALTGDTDTYDHRMEKVSLITMHAAKGLEFPVVFISGCEDDCIPYRSTSRPVDVQEERRLFYVALTRAKQHLFLTRAAVRRIHGQRRPRRLSPFVDDIENNYKQFGGQSGSRPRKSAQEQLSLF
jgi:DNA helicase II / ATP-dependent DNA helicase PcrA